MATRTTTRTTTRRPVRELETGRKSKKAAKVKPPFLYKVLGPAMAIPTGIVVKKAADVAWLKVRGYPPPKNPAAPGVTWPDALAWAAVSGVLYASGRLVAARGAAAVYTKLTGHVPPAANAASAA